MNNDTLRDVICPKCGSPDWKRMTKAEMFLVGAGLAGIGVLLSIFLIGIPMVIFGLIMMILAPFGTAMNRCQRCKKTWRADGRVRTKKKLSWWFTGPMSPWK